MRLVVACCALLAVAASSRGGCGKTPYEPCAGKACGAACTACPADDPGCVETAVVKACDAAGACAAAGSFECPATDPCAGKACGAECVVEPACRWASPPCMLPSMLGHCDATSACQQGEVSCSPADPDPCAGKACGETCNPCGAVPCMTLVATSCDGSGQCVPTTPWVCYDACAGKQRDEPCSICPPDATDCVAPMCVTSCDGAGRCLCSGSDAASP